MSTITTSCILKNIANTPREKFSKASIRGYYKIPLSDLLKKEVDALKNRKYTLDTSKKAFYLFQLFEKWFFSGTSFHQILKLKESGDDDIKIPLPKKVNTKQFVQNSFRNLSLHKNEILNILYKKTWALISLKTLPKDLDIFLFKQFDKIYKRQYRSTFDCLLLTPNFLLFPENENLKEIIEDISKNHLNTRDLKNGLNRDEYFHFIWRATGGALFTKKGLKSQLFQKTCTFLKQKDQSITTTCHTLLIKRSSVEFVDKKICYLFNLWGDINQTAASNSIHKLLKEQKTKPSHPLLKVLLQLIKKNHKKTDGICFNLDFNKYNYPCRITYFIRAYNTSYIPGIKRNRSWR